MKKFLLIILTILLLVFIGLAIRIYSNIKDQHPGYNADLHIISNKVSALKAGFSALTITPIVPDRWTDKNGDARYVPKDGDSYIDGNANGKFDPVWIAGFGNRRAANGIHDDLWARTMIIDDGNTRLAIIALDLIGFMNNAVIDARKMIPDAAGITYSIVVSTHNHEGPDMLGMWGKSPLSSGINTDYLSYVKSRIVKSVEDAVSNLRPAYLEISEDLTGAASLVGDTRRPEVLDYGLRIIKVIDNENEQTLGSLTSWADHPETLWGKNLLITSDFPEYLRSGIENGIFNGDTLKETGIGGISIFVNGAIGGLMTTHPEIAVEDPFTGMEYTEPSFEKAEAQGKQLALLALSAMKNPAEKIDSAGISLIVKTVYLPVDNKLFKLGTILGIFKRGTSGWMKMRSELSVFRIGSISFATLPGEVYPELINGGIEAPEGNDFQIEQVETPPIREMMQGRFKFILGLASDEIGYIIPQSQWDVESPYTYNSEEAPYGEENSLGPQTAILLHNNLKEMIDRLNQK